MIEVVWSERAKRDLRDIHARFREAGKEKFANQLIAYFLRRTLELKRFPELGQIDLDLEGKSLTYRSLVAGNYKIIYWTEPARVSIATIFDARKDPTSLWQRLP